jgi:hypothetical protein
MRVSIEREPDGRVPEPLGDLLGVSAAFDQESNAPTEAEQAGKWKFPVDPDDDDVA